MQDPQAGLRQQWKAYSKAVAAGERLEMPAELHELRCGAKTRAGTPCKRRDLYAPGRCRLHGGLSSGPKSGPRAKRPEPPAPPPEPYDPAQDPKMREIFRRQGIHI